MAKKVLTPEQQEIKAIKKEKRGQNWTKFWAILLAFVLVAGISFGGYKVADKNSAPVEGNEVVNQGGDTNTNSTDVQAPVDNSTDTPADQPADTPADQPADTPADQPADKPADNGGSNEQAPAANDKAAVAAAINKATAAAVNAKAGYDWERHCAVKDVNVGKITNFLNGIISKISEGDDVNSVVGGFLGDGDRKETINKGETLATKIVKKDDGTTEQYYHGANYTLKATQLKADDIQNLQVNGNTYSFTLPDSTNPDRNGNTALSRFTNDIVIKEEVEKEIQGYTTAVTIPSLQANYKQIKATVTIENGKLTGLTYSFYADAALDVKVAIATVTGTGNLTCNAKYSNFKY